MAYARNIAYTIDHTQVGGTNLTDFNVVVRGTFPELRTVSNGGSIYNIGQFGEPADFVVSPNQDGSNKYDFQIPVYDPSDGTIEIYFRLPVLSASADQPFYLVFSDPAVTTFQGSAHVGTHPEWTNYKGVYHFHGGFATDASASAAHGSVNGPTATTGVIGTGLNFAGGGDVVSVPTFPDYARPMTFEFWLKLPAGNIAFGVSATILQAATFRGNFLIYPRPDYEGRGFATINLFTSGGEAGIPYPTDGGWHHYLLAIDASGTMAATLDGVPQAVTTITPGPLDPHTSTALKFGNGLGPLVGALDEVRLSNIVRPLAWGTASYNNQKSGSTFLRRVNGAAGYAGSQRLRIDHTQVGGSDLVDFPLLVQGTFPELRLVGFGGLVNNLDSDAAPADFVFAPNRDGSNKYDFKFIYYDWTTGTIEAWVRIPSVSASVDTTFFMAYGDPAVTTSQSNHPGVWASSYKGVYLFEGGFGPDQTSNHFNGEVRGPTSTSGQVGGALSFAGGTDVVDVPTFPDYARPMTFEFWLMLPAGEFPIGVSATILQAATFRGNFLIYPRPDFEGRGFATINVFTNGGEAGIPYPTDGGWHHYLLAINAAGTLSATFDGVPQAVTTITPGALDPHTSTALKFGNGLGPLHGNLDEVRLSNIVRPLNWGTASYNNQKFGSTLVTAASLIASRDIEEPWDEEQWDDLAEISP